jgi:hypothetical protein
LIIKHKNKKFRRFHSQQQKAIYLYTYIAKKAMLANLYISTMVKIQVGHSSEQNQANQIF